jgi:hypothetical protein
MRYRLGDKVWTISNGWGKIIEIVEDDEYPIRVSFEGNLCEMYTEDGRGLAEDFAPSLFFNELDKDNEVLKRPLDELVHGHIYEVWDDDEGVNCRCLRYYNEHSDKFVSCVTSLGEDYGLMYDNWVKIN